MMYYDLRGQICARELTLFPVIIRNDASQAIGKAARGANNVEYEFNMILGLRKRLEQLECMVN